MRWYKKSTLLRDQVAKTRVVSNFVWFPKCLPDEKGRDEWRWLEQVHIKQSVRRIDRGGVAGCDYKYCWCDDHWFNPDVKR